MGHLRQQDSLLSITAGGLMPDGRCYPARRGQVRAHYVPKCGWLRSGSRDGGDPLASRRRDGSAAVALHFAGGFLQELEGVVEVVGNRRRRELDAQRFHRTVEDRVVAALEEREVVQAVAHRRDLVAGGVEARDDALLLAADAELEALEHPVRLQFEAVREQDVPAELAHERLGEL